MAEFGERGFYFLDGYNSVLIFARKSKANSRIQHPQPKSPFKEVRTPMQVSLQYSLHDGSGEGIESGKAEAQIDEENVSVLTESGNSIFIPLRDIIKIDPGDYNLSLLLTSDQELILAKLGHKFEDFLRTLSAARNRLLMKDMLMHEALKKSGISAEFVYIDEKDQERQNGKCELRLYETALVIIPEKDEIKRILFNNIDSIEEKDYRLILALESGEKIGLSKMGRQHDSFKEVLSTLINELSLKVQSSLKELLPGVDPSVLREASTFMKEGKAARRSDIESLSPELWIELEKKLEVADVKDEYDFLRSLSQQQEVCIGLKRGLLGDLTGEYVWFLIPIYSTDPQEPGNAIAMEATSAQGGGKATYFFRITSKEDYPKFVSMEDLHKEVDNLTKELNRSMLAINFRREPIYLPDEKLREPQYQKYRFAIEKIPELRRLRQIFIGRVIHRSPEQWKNDVMDLLVSNVETSGAN